MQVGLNYICATAERFFAVGAVLASMVTGHAEQVNTCSHLSEAGVACAVQHHNTVSGGHRASASQRLVNGKLS